jgi:hypothetical protein
VHEEEIEVPPQGVQGLSLRMVPKPKQLPTQGGR